MVTFDRKKDELPPFVYSIGDKIMGYHSSVGDHVLVGGEIIEREQSLDGNEYKVRPEPELCEGRDVGKDFILWINEKEAKPFKRYVWDRVVRHWLEYGRLQRKGYLEYVRMHRALREEPDDISDAVLEKELEEKHNVKG